MRLWGPRGEDEAIIGEEEEAAYADLDSPSLEEITQNNQGSMESGETPASIPVGSASRPPCRALCSRFHESAGFLRFCHITILQVVGIHHYSTNQRGFAVFTITI